MAVGDEPLDGVGDLELAPRRRIDRGDGLVARVIDAAERDDTVRVRTPIAVPNEAGESFT